MKTSKVSGLFVVSIAVFAVCVAVASVATAAGGPEDLLVISPIAGDEPVVGHPTPIVLRFNGPVNVQVLNNQHAPVSLDGNGDMSLQFLNSAPDAAGYSFGRIAWVPNAAGTYNVRLTPANGGTSVDGPSFNVAAATQNQPVQIVTQIVASVVTTTTVVTAENPINTIVFPAGIMVGEVAQWEIDFPMGAVSAAYVKFDEGAWTQPSSSNIQNGYALFGLVFSTPTTHSVQFKTTTPNGDILSPKYDFVVDPAGAPVSNHALSFDLDREMLAGSNPHVLRDILHATGSTLGTEEYRVYVTERVGRTILDIRYTPNKVVIPKKG